MQNKEKLKPSYELILDELKKSQIKFEVKGYQEIPAREGYHMTCYIYINGKKALFLEDQGNGGGAFPQVINEIAAKPYLEVIERVNKYIKEYYGNKESKYKYELVNGAEVLAYFGDKIANEKQIKKQSKNCYLFRDFEDNNNSEYNAMDVYKYNKKYNFMDVVKTLKKHLIDNNMKYCEFYNETTKQWDKYEVEKLEESMKQIEIVTQKKVSTSDFIKNLRAKQ